MIDKQSIILGFHRHGKKKKQLSRELGISLRTIKKYLKAHQKEMAQAGLDPTALPLGGIIQAPSYDTSNRKKPKMTEEITSAIDDYLKKNEKKKSQGKHKQLMKSTDIHQALVNAGHKVSYRSVCRSVKEKKYKCKEVFILQQYNPGQAVEFDWGEVKLCINGVNKRFMLAVFTSCYSNHRWARLYYRQDTSSFLDSHAQYFKYTGGVQQEVVYDNMRTAVRKFAIKNTDKEPTEALLKMSCYYQFNYRFCNARKGNEKGHVEKSVEYIRRKAFAPKDNFDSVDGANLHLLQTCEQLNLKPITGKTTPIQSNFEEELQYMKVAAPTYDSAQITRLRVDKYSCVKVDTNWYSVKEGHVGEMLNVKIYPNQILVYGTDNQIIATHVRQNTVYEYFLKIDHYLKTLYIKPGALLGSLSLKQADETLRNIFNNHFSSRSRLFVELLLFICEKDFDIPQFQAAVDQCLSLCPHQEVSADKIKVFLQMKLGQEEPSSNGTDAHSTQIAQYANQQLQANQSLISQH